MTTSSKSEMMLASLARTARIIKINDGIVEGRVDDSDVIGVLDKIDAISKEIESLIEVGRKNV